MTTVFLVSDDSDCGPVIRAVFSAREEAERYRNEGGYANVEAWQLDAEQGKRRRYYYDCGIDMETGEIVHRSLLPSRLWELAFPADRGYTRISTTAWYNKGRETLIARSYESMEQAVELAMQTWRAGVRANIEYLTGPSMPCMGDLRPVVLQREKE